MAVHERTGNLNVWWFPKEFSQSHFGEYHHAGTNSCTLITLLLADKVAKGGREFHRPHNVDLPRRAVDVFALAINEGNSAYHRAITSLAKQKRSQNLNIPDAMKTLSSDPDFKLREWYYTHMQANPENESPRTIALRLMQVINSGIEKFRRVDENWTYYLFAALIADNRTVLFAFEFFGNHVTFYDSHQHGREAGAVIAQCQYKDVYEMLFWFVNMNQTVYGSQPTIYEVSFLTHHPGQLPVPDRMGVGTGKPIKVQAKDGTTKETSSKESKAKKTKK